MRTEQLTKKLHPALFDKDALGHGSNKKNGASGPASVGLAKSLAADNHGQWQSMTSTAGERGHAADPSTGPKSIGTTDQKLSTLGGHHVITNGDKEHPHYVAGAGIVGHLSGGKGDGPHDLSFDKYHGMGMKRTSTTGIAVARHAGVENGEGMYTLHTPSGEQMKFDHRGKSQEKFTPAGAVAALARYHMGED